MSAVNLTLQDFINSNWESVIDLASKQECSEFERLLGAKTRELMENGGDAVHIEVFRLLTGICSMRMDMSNPDQPFTPAFVWENSRGMMVDDITDERLNVLIELVPYISNVEIKARICDILWVVRRNHRMAKTAVECYLESAKILEDPEHWSSCVQRIERARDIALYLGRQNQPVRDVIDHIELVLDKYQGNDPLFLTCRLMELLIELREGDAGKYSALAQKVALRSESESNWHRARQYWIVKSKWDRLAGNEVAERESLIRCAETYIKEAVEKTVGEKTSFSVASVCLQNAIDAHRKIGGQQARVAELHRLLLEYQKKAISEFKAVSVPFDPTAQQEKARSSVAGKLFLEALETIALMPNPKIDAIKDEVLNEAQQFPLQHLFTAVTVNEKGKVVHRQPGMMSDDPKEREAAIRAEMIKRVTFLQQFSVVAYIEPARQQILIEHYVRESDFRNLVRNSAFVPQDREHIFARGLFAGFKGDFLVSIHLLIPQIENSIRYVLEQHGVTTSYLNQEGIQEEKDINTLLYMSELTGILGEDLVFDLQCLLVERVGGNLRNRMAHGLLSDWHFITPLAEYVWWITLKLCYIGWLSVVRQQGNNSKQTSIRDETKS